MTDDIRRVLRVLDWLAYALSFAMICSGLAIVANAFTPDPDMSKTTQSVLTLLAGAVFTVLSGAVSAAMTGTLPLGTSRAVAALGIGISVFFALFVVGVLISGARTDDGITQRHADVITVITIGVLSIVAFAAGNAAGKAFGEIYPVSQPGQPELQTRAHTSQEEAMTDPSFSEGDIDIDQVTGVPLAAEVEDPIDPGFAEDIEPDYGWDDAEPFEDDDADTEPGQESDEDGLLLDTDESVAAVPLEED